MPRCAGAAWCGVRQVQFGERDLLSATPTLPFRVTALYMVKCFVLPLMPVMAWALLAAGLALALDDPRHAGDHPRTLLALALHGNGDREKLRQAEAAALLAATNVRSVPAARRAAGVGRGRNIFADRAVFVSRELDRLERNDRVVHLLQFVLAAAFAAPVGGGRDAGEQREARETNGGEAENTHRVGSCC